MYIDPMTTNQVHRQEHELRIAHAHRRRLANQAAVLHGRHPIARAIGRWTGNALVAAGERLRGTPRASGVAESSSALQAGGQP